MYNIKVEVHEYRTSIFREGSIHIKIKNMGRIYNVTHTVNIQFQLIIFTFIIIITIINNKTLYLYILTMTIFFFFI